MIKVRYYHRRKPVADGGVSGSHVVGFDKTESPKGDKERVIDWAEFLSPKSGLKAELKIINVSNC